MYRISVGLGERLLAMMLSFGGMLVDAAELPQTDGMMVFGATADDSWDLYAWYGGERSRLVQLTDTAFDEKSPATSRDGKLVAFVDSAGELRVLDLASGDERVLAAGTHPGRWSSPSFCADGSHLFCSYSEKGARDWSTLVVVDLASEQVELPLSQYGPQYSPACAPAGSQVIYGYAHCSTACGRIIQEPWLFDRISGHARQLLMLGGNSTGFDWSPGGGRIVFSSDWKGGFDLWLLTLESGSLRRLTDHPGLDASPAFSPDGRKVAFISNRSGKEKIWVLDLGTDSVSLFDPLGPEKDAAYRDVDWR